MSDCAPCYVGIHQNCWRSISTNLCKVKSSYEYFLHETGIFNAGDMSKMASLLRPDIGIVTTIGRDHYTSFRTLDATAAEKGKLIKSLPDSGIAVLNADDPYVMGMQNLSGARVLTYGLTDAADVHATDIRSFWPERLTLTIAYRGETVRINTRLFGDLLTTSLLAAVAGALAAGVSLEQCKRSLDGAYAFPSRQSIHQNSRGAWFINDTYKASYWSVEQVVSLMKEARAPRKTVVMGEFSDIGSNESKKYRAMARLGLTVADRVVFVGRTSKYVRKMLTPETQDRLFLFDSTKSAAEFIVEEAMENELIMLKSNTSSHLERLMLDHLKEFTCWKDPCEKPIQCTECKEAGVVSRSSKNDKRKLDS